MKEDIQEIKNDLNKNKSIINGFIRNLKEVRNFISQLIVKNKNLEENSKKLINQIKKCQKEIIELKNENANLIKYKNNINYNNKDNIKEINNESKEELRKYKIENKKLRYLLIKINNNRINKNKNIIINKIKPNLNNNKEKNSLIKSKGKKISKELNLIKTFKEDNLNN